MQYLCHRTQSVYSSVPNLTTKKLKMLLKLYQILEYKGHIPCAIFKKFAAVVWCFTMHYALVVKIWME